MDPVANINEQLLLANRLRDEIERNEQFESSEDVHRLAELVITLAEWQTLGGFGSPYTKLRGMDMSKHRTELHQNLINRVNAFLKDSPDDAKPTREILASVLSSFLMEADSYRGFNYIYWTETGCEQWRAAGEPEGTGEKDEFIYGPSGDQSRIVYY